MNLLIEDAIKLGVIENIASFISVLQPERRESMIEVFLQLQKDQRKWRIRELIASQLDKLATLFSKDIVYQIITPIGFKLCTDAVSIVREEASRKMAFILDALYNTSDEKRFAIVSNIKSFSQSNRFIMRQG